MRQQPSKRALALAACTCVLLAVAALRAQPGAGTVLAPSVGGALEVDHPVHVGAVGDQTALAAAHLGGGDFVAVWRTALWEGEVRAARIPASGALPEPRGLILPGLEGTDAQLGVAAAGGRVLVASASEGKLHVVSLGGDGGGFTPAPAVLLASAAGAELGRPAVLAQGSTFWVAWSQNGAGVLALPVSPAGAPLAVAPLVLSAAPGSVALAGDGLTALAIWSTATGGTFALRGARLGGDSPSGYRVLDAAPLELGSFTGRAGPVSLAVGAGLFLAVVGAEGSAPGGSGVLSTVSALRLGAGGQPLDGPPRALAEVAAPLAGGPSVAWNGSRFLVLWSEATRPPPPGVAAVGASAGAPEGRLVGSDGAVSPLGLPGLGAAGEQPVAVAGEGQVLALLARPPGGRGDLDIRGLRFGADGAIAGNDFLVSGGVNWQGNPALATGRLPGGADGSDRGRMLLSWEDSRADRLGGDIHVSLRDDSGAPVGAGALALATGPAGQRAPAVAWDGQGFQVVWHEQGRGLMATRLSADGAILDRPPLLVPGSGGRQVLSDPVLCGDEAGALLVFGARVDRGASAPPVGELRVVRIPPGGTVRDGASLPLLTTHDVSTPPSLRLACAAEGALLVWSGLYDQDRSGLPDLYMAQIPRGGELGPPRVSLLEDGAAEEGPSVASDGRGFLVVWRPRQVGGARVTVFGTRVDASGAGLDRPARELGSLNAGHRLSVHWDGWQWVLVGIQSLGINDFQLRGRRVRADLGALDPDWFAIDKVSSRRGTGSALAVAGLGRGAAVVGYESFLDDDATGNQRLAARLITTPALDPSAMVAALPDGGAPLSDGPPPPAPAARSDGAKARGAGCSCSLGERGRPSDEHRSPWLLLALLAAVAGHARRQRRRPR